jgi:hypothetical protein
MNNIQLQDSQNMAQAMNSKKNLQRRDIRRLEGLIYEMKEEMKLLRMELNDTKKAARSTRTSKKEEKQD